MVDKVRSAVAIGRMQHVRHATWNRTKGGGEQEGSKNTWKLEKD